jgi:hypothetical protein
MDQGPPIGYWRHNAPKNGQAVFVTESLTLSSTLAQFLGLAAEIERFRPKS